MALGKVRFRNGVENFFCSTVFAAQRILYLVDIIYFNLLVEMREGHVFGIAMDRCFGGYIDGPPKTKVMCLIEQRYFSIILLGEIWLRKQ